MNLDLDEIEREEDSSPKCPVRGKIYPLHCHTNYSILDAASSVEEYLDYCVKNHIPSCSCTDHGYVMGHYDLLTLSRKKGIKPIPGIEAYLHPGDDYEFRKKVRLGEVQRDKEGMDVVDKFDYFHLTLWARNMNGYRNLTMLSNASWSEGRVIAKWGNLKPRITWFDLETFSEDLICGTGCAFGPVNYPLSRGEQSMAEVNLERLMRIFSGRLFVEIIPTSIRREYKKSVVTVMDSNGRKFFFDPDDILMTDKGEITAKEAAAQRVNEVSSASPRRRQGAEITGDYHTRRIII